MLKSSPHAHYLSFKESIVIALIPPFVFLLNGIWVLTLKTIEAPIAAYLSLPVTLLGLTVFTIRRGLDKSGLRPRGFLKKYGFVLLIPLIFAALHFYFFGTSYGTDTSAYYTNPMQSFFATGYFSHSEAPFMEFGQQPLAVYWLPANSEFIFAGIGKIFGLEYRQILALMHLTANYCFGLVLFVISLRFFNFPVGVTIWASLLALIYGLQNTRMDFASTALFRGFENKGFIWGYFFWAILTVFIPGTDAKISRLHWTAAGLILGAASFLVSGNAAFVLFPAAALCLGAIISGQFKSLYAYAGFFAGLMGLIFMFKMLEVTDVYSVVSKDLTPRIPDSYDIQALSFAFPRWLWVFAGAAIIAAAITRLKLAIQLGVFLGLCLIIQSEAYFNLCLQYSMEFTLVFWRHASLMNPLVPFILGGFVLLSHVKKPQIQSLISLAVVALCGVGFMTRVLNLPDKSPFPPATKQPVMMALSEICPEGSLILAQIGFSTQMPVIQPHYRYLGSRQAFLNWQIANLPSNSKIRRQATDVRDSLIYLKRDRITGEFPVDTDAIERTIEFYKPDAIFLTRTRLTKENKHLFSGYNRQNYKGTIVFTNDTCRTDFNALVKNKIQG